MATMLGNETSLYLFGESVLPLIDQGPAGKDSDSSNGTPTFNGKVMSTDGISAQAIFTSGVGVSPFVWTNAGGASGYAKFINQESIASQNGTNIIIFGPEAPGQNAGPFLFWDDINIVNGLRPSININDGGATTINLLLGREMNLGEIFVWAWTWNFSTQAFIHVIKSNQGIDLNGSGTGTIKPEDDKSFHIGGSAQLNCFFKGGFDQMGVVIGSQFTLSELQADANALLFPVTGIPRSRQVILLGAGAQRSN